MPKRFLTTLLFFFVIIARTWAHPETEEELLALNAEIEKNSTDASLLMRRATCFEHRGDHALAELDLEKAAKLEPKSFDAHLQLVALLLADRRFEEAKKNLDQVIELQPNHIEALVWRARLRVAAHSVPAAYADFSRALAQIAEPPPELYLEQAALPIPPEQALDGLKEGLRRLGPVVALSERVIGLEMQLGRWDAAIAHLDALFASADRKEIYLKRRGDLLATAGRQQAAREAYLSALNEIARLPAWQRESRASVELALELQHLIIPTS